MENRRILERGIYPLIAFVMWITALVGFWPGYVGPAIDGNLAKTSAVHFHVVVYVGWLVLFTIVTAWRSFGAPWG